MYWFGLVLGLYGPIQCWLWVGLGVVWLALGCAGCVLGLCWAWLGLALGWAWAGQGQLWLGWLLVLGCFGFGCGWVGPALAPAHATCQCPCPCPWPSGLLRILSRFCWAPARMGCDGIFQIGRFSWLFVDSLQQLDIFGTESPYLDVQGANFPNRRNLDQIHQMAASCHHNVKKFPLFGKWAPCKSQ